MVVLRELRFLMSEVTLSGKLTFVGNVDTHGRRNGCIRVIDLANVNRTRGVRFTPNGSSEELDTYPLDVTYHLSF